jgi:septation ring formation regulator EzrA
MSFFYFAFYSVTMDSRLENIRKRLNKLKANTTALRYQGKPRMDGPWKKIYELDSRLKKLYDEILHDIAAMEKSQRNINH